MRKTLCASVLVLALCVPTLAGEILNPPAPVNPNDPTGGTQPTDDQPGADRGGEETSELSADGLKEAALAVLGSMLALL